MRRFSLALAATAAVALAASAQPGGPKGPPGGFPKGGPGPGGVFPKGGPGPGGGIFPKGGPGPGGGLVFPKGGPGGGFIIPKLGPGGLVGPFGPPLMPPLGGPIPLLPPIVTNSVVIPVLPMGGSDIEPVQEWGMKITQVADGGAAAKANLQVGQIIVYAAGTRIQSFEELTGILARATGPVEIVVYLEKTRSLAKTTVTPVNGKIGIATDPVVIGQ